MSEIFDKAQKKQTELFEQITNSKKIQSERPLFHFATPGGWCNDPNGFSEFNGKVHLFYQYNPYSTQWGSIHWGHVVSEDMLNWQLQPVALAPDKNADDKGCFSGTALGHKGKHIIAYTGVSNNGKINIQNQCIAIGDGRVYEKLKCNPVITAGNIPFEYNPEDFRDPKIWKKDEKFYMACVIKQKDNHGAIVVFESDNLEKWTYKGILDSSKDGLSNMWECPDVSVVDGKDILIFSPQEMKENYNLGFHDGNNSVYVTGNFDYKNFKFSREIRPENGYTTALLDYGIDFYAPETTKLSDGRTIMIAWMQTWESYITPENYIWSGMMTLPRELSFKNNRLYQLPIRELENWKTDNQSGECKTATKTPIFTNSQRHFELDLTFDENATGNMELSLTHADEKVILNLDLSTRSIFFDRLKSLTPGAIFHRQAKLRTDDKKINLKIIGDTCSLEVFVNDGIMTFTNTFFFSDEKSDLTVNNNTSCKIKYDFWKIKHF